MGIGCWEWVNHTYLICRFHQFMQLQIFCLEFIEDGGPIPFHFDAHVVRLRLVSGLREGVGRYGG